MTHSIDHSRSPLRASPWKHAAWLTFALSVPLFSAGEARAAEGCAEECPKGYTCQSGPGACPAIACAEGQNCPPCNPEPVHYCAPAACTSDDQCGADQVCAEQVTSGCAEIAPAPACPPNEPCDVPAVAPADCTPETHSYCTPRWQLPCTVAADCGAGFECVPQERCSAGGSPGTPGTSGSGTSGSGSSAGAGTPGSSAATPTEPAPSSPGQEAVPPTPPGGGDGKVAPPPPTVTCEPAGYSACIPIQVACTTDADCVSGWSCLDNPNGVCWSGPDGGGCTPADPPKLCMPPSYYGGPGAPEGGVGTPTSAGNPGEGPGAEEPALPPRNDSGLGATPVPANPSAAESTDSSASEGGCSMSAAPASASGLAWLVLGLAGMFGVRRRRS